MQLAKVGSPALPDCAGPLRGVDAKHREARRVQRHLRLHAKVQHVGDHLRAHTSVTASLALCDACAMHTLADGLDTEALASAGSF